MWKKINSPIVITIIVIATVFILKATTRPKWAGEIRGAYEELNAIIEDGSTDAEKSKAIRQFAQEIATQAREGLSAGFKTSDSPKDNKNKVYIDVKQKISISGIKYVQSQYPNREKIILVLKNNSNKYISSLKLNYEYYKQGELIDCINQWAHEVKILEPNQEIAISQERTLPQEDPDTYKSDEVKIKITSFDIKQID